MTSNGIPESGALALEVRDLTKTYQLGLRMRRVAALDGLNLKVKAGSIFGFVGPNGAGKSTTIKMITGLIAPTRGEASIFGQPFTKASSREAIGYLPENPSFHDFLRPLEVLEFFGRLSGLSGEPLRRRAVEMLEMVGLSRAQDLTVRKFSKGMVQRLGLAQAMIHDPPLLILDEPMSGLDPIGRKEVRDLMLELRRRGKTIFFSTHILPDVETICDEVGMLFGGRLVAQGSLSTLLDGSVRAVEVRCAGLSAETVSALSASAQSASSSSEGWTFLFGDLADANQAAARVVAAGGRITLLQAQRESLEESFVRLAAATAHGEAGEGQSISG
jgi:ABC-2 type transport system ATP-binding protein